MTTVMFRVSSFQHELFFIILVSLDKIADTHTYIFNDITPLTIYPLIPVFSFQDFSGDRQGLMVGFLFLFEGLFSHAIVGLDFFMFSTACLIEVFLLLDNLLL